MKIYKTDIPLYFGKLIIVFSKDFDKTVTKLKLDTKGHTNLNGFTSFVMAQPNKRGITRYYMILAHDIDNSIIAHEALHVTNWIMNDRLIRPDFVNDEPQCYLLGWVVAQVEKAKRKLIK